MGDTGVLIDLVAVGMVVAVIGLGALAVVPCRWFRWARWTALVLTVGGVSGAAVVLSASATIYGDGASHWTHTPHGAALVGFSVAALAVGLLVAARHSAPLMLSGLASSFLAMCLLVASVFAYHTPG